MSVKKISHKKGNYSNCSTDCNYRNHKREYLIRTLINMFLSAFLILLCMVPIALALPANWANHVVISEVYHSPIDRDTEFIELYNPTNQRVNITMWSLWTELSLPGAEVIFPSNTFIEPYGYYLIGDTEYNANKDTSWPEADLVNSIDLGSSHMDARDAGILLGNSAYDEVDAVGWGDSSLISDPDLYEGTTLANIPSPGHSASYERKPGDGGVGNGVDTNNNINDFIARITPTLSPNPQSSQSPQEIPEGAGTTCNTAADTDCNNDVSDIELLTYASRWISGQINDGELLQAAAAWMNG